MKHEPLFRILTEIVEVICRRHLDDLRIFTEDQDGVRALVVMPHSADYPRLVGRHGGQVHAAEYLVQRAGVRLGERIKYSLKESFIGEREPIERFAYNPDFSVMDFERRLHALAFCVTGKAWDFTVTPSGESLIVFTPCERNGSTETFLSAIEAVLRPYCYGDGRKLHIKPQFINQKYETTHTGH